MVNESDINEAGLKSRLSVKLEEEIAQTDILGTDPNLVVGLSTEQQQNAYILRTPSPLKQSNLTAALRQEYELLQRLAKTSIPVPTPVMFCDDPSEIGESYYVRTHLDGISVPFGEDLPEQYQSATARSAVAERMLERLVEIHALDVAPFEDVLERISPAERVRRSIARLDQATEVTGREQPLLRNVADWLIANVPADTSTALVHGDYKPNNVLLSETGPPQVVGVIDWEIATLGDPLIDLGFFLLFWRDSGDPTPSVAELENAYPDRDILDFLKQVNEGGIWPFTNDPGSPTRREIVAHYEQLTNTTLENGQFYHALAAFIVATFWEFAHGQSVAAADNAPETIDTDYEPLADYMTSIADSIVNGRLEL